MRTFLVIIASAALAGLLIPFGLHFMQPIVVQAGNVLISLDIFIGLITALTLVSSTLSQLFGSRLRHGDALQLQDLQKRITRLEPGARAD